MPVKESWRSLTQVDQHHFQEWVQFGLIGRLKKGEELYQSHIHGFQGDPLQHAAEEWLDMGLYLFMAFRERDAERKNVRS